MLTHDLGLRDDAIEGCLPAKLDAFQPKVLEYRRRSQNHVQRISSPQFFVRRNLKGGHHDQGFDQNFAVAGRRCRIERAGRRQRCRAGGRGRAMQRSPGVPRAIAEALRAMPQWSHRMCALGLRGSQVRGGGLPEDVGWTAHHEAQQNSLATVTVGTARSLSSGRASCGPVGAFAYATLALTLAGLSLNGERQTRPLYRAARGSPPPLRRRRTNVTLPSSPSRQCRPTLAKCWQRRRPCLRLCLPLL
jgi:hypothetical protein